MERLVIVVTGTPGVGKSSVSRRLAERLEGSHIDLNELVTKERLFSGYEADRDTHILDLGGVSARVEAMAQTSPRVLLVESHVAHLVVPRSLLKLCLVLRCNPEVLKGRLEARGYPVGKVRENLASEVLDVCLVEAFERYGRRKVVEIDTTATPIEESVSEAYRILTSVRKPRRRWVDWISDLEDRGLLWEYLQ